MTIVSFKTRKGKKISFVMHTQREKQMWRYYEKHKKDR